MTPPNTTHTPRLSCLLLIVVVVALLAFAANAPPPPQVDQARAVGQDVALTQIEIAWLLESSVLEIVELRRADGVLIATVRVQTADALTAQRLRIRARQTWPQHPPLRLTLVDD
jgi:hypothetical protein